MAVAIGKFIWDITYACPLRCVHCYTESGRRPARTLDRDAAMRVIDRIIAAQAKKVSISGGEPLSVRWALEAMRRLHDAGIAVTVFTSGWSMPERTAGALAESVASVAVSVDGADPAIHDTVRGRPGAFERGLRALDTLHRVKLERQASGQGCYTFGIDYTLTRSGAREADLERFVAMAVERFPGLDFIRFGAVIPSGLAAEKDFEDSELLSIDELVGMIAVGQRLAAQAGCEVDISVTDVRYFLPQPGISAVDLDIAHIEPDGALRAFPIYEAKVGNILDESLESLWPKVRAWRSDPFVVGLMESVKTMADWAHTARSLDMRYGSADDQARILQRRAPMRLSA
ncbi:radical SAM protein [Microvirga pudoricolor]|uniref:radical SAM protein n=1 Tax=Microvirga pudoricolor TaxID=2778729 RepID=UPI00194F6888|nr:radical SAM protein [Microvirga pudoricolor]MBM6596008.1 radical SAM protein [Microvirga pudoricolor]